MSTPGRGSRRPWRPGRDVKAEHILAAAGRPTPEHERSVVVVGAGIGGLAAATGLAERGVQVTLVEREMQLGGRVRSWPISRNGHEVTMSRGFHAFFRQYYNLRQLLRRADPELAQLQTIGDYPLTLKGGHRDSFAKIPRTPPFSIAGFVARSPSFRLADVGRVDVDLALSLLDVDFPRTFSDLDGISAATFLDRLRFPDGARHLALEVFARSFFADPEDFAAGELVAMFHSYFVGSAEGLIFDVPIDDYDSALWSPLRRYLLGLGVKIITGRSVDTLDHTDDGMVVRLDDGESLVADAAVLAADPATTRALLGRLADADQRLGQLPVGALRSAPPFAVWRLWLDRHVKADRAPFLGTSGYGPLDNISIVDRFEDGACRWSERNGGSVVELHAYAVSEQVLSEPGAETTLKRDLRQALAEVYPETATAGVVLEEWRVEQDCPLIDTSPWANRPTVTTADPCLVLAGDGIRCDYPVALMERAATTGWMAANALLQTWGVRGHDLWTVPLAARHRWPALARRGLAAFSAASSAQPGNSPIRRKA